MSEPILTVKNWHVVLVLISWLVFGVMAYADLRAQTIDNARRIHDIEERPSVTLMQYQDGQRTLEQRLDRIERKLDDADNRRH